MRDEFPVVGHVNNENVIPKSYGVNVTVAMFAWSGGPSVETSRGAMVREGVVVRVMSDRLRCRASASNGRDAVSRPAPRDRAVPDPSPADQWLSVARDSTACEVVGHEPAGVELRVVEQRAISRYVTPGEREDVASTLPKDVAAMLPAGS